MAKTRNNHNKTMEHSEKDSIKSAVATLLGRFMRHFEHFPVFWVTFAVLLISAIASLIPCLWKCAEIVMLVALAFFVIILIRKPMSIVYGLIGTSGNISIFFINFFFVSFIFALIYHMTFFSHAEISYDVNQPHISFDMKRWEGHDQADIAYTVIPSTSDTPGYQKIRFGFVLRNTIMTSLIQEPTDFFSVAATYNEVQSLETAPSYHEARIDKQKARLFNLILIFQILISWIFLGVFISLLFIKFRKES